MNWPPRSPDLTPMEFFLWGHIKALIYTTPVDSGEDLSGLLLRQQQPGIFERTSVSAASLSTVYRGRWPCVSTSALNW